MLVVKFGEPPGESDRNIYWDSDKDSCHGFFESFPKTKNITAVK